jgi:Effector Associated Constant Component 1
MSADAILISFANVSTAEANQLASSLAEVLRDVDPGIVVDRQRERPDTQDFGASLAVVLGTAAATAFAKGIAAWLSRNSGACVEIRCKGKPVVIASHLASKDVSRIVEVLSSED